MFECCFDASSIESYTNRNHAAMMVTMAAVLASMLLVDAAADLPQWVDPINCALTHGEHGASSFDCRPNELYVPTGQSMPSHPKLNTS